MISKKLYRNRQLAIVLIACSLVTLVLSSCHPLTHKPTLKDKLFARDNLVAWCIVPFDPAKRNPQQRAQMLQRLGLKKVAYDWRAEHVPTFEQEILAYQQHNLDYFAFWGWHPDMAKLIKKYNIHPQIWMMIPNLQKGTQQEKVQTAGEKLLPMAQKALALGCKFGLYNHGGWGGEPENMVAVCQWLRKKTASDQIGIVYNLHHGHEHIADFREVLALMKPYLFCLNLNGMNDNAKPKIIPLGQGQHELQMLRIILQSGYSGPIGILDHRSNVDTEKSLKENLDGLQQLLKQL